MNKIDPALQTVLDAKLSPKEFRKLPRQRQINVVVDRMIAIHGEQRSG